MPSFRTRRVHELLDERPGLQRFVLDDGSRAYALTALIGTVDVGDEVVVNTTAVELGLGTGGWHVVHWNLAHRDLDLPGAGHIMKVRYTSLQVDTGAAEETIGADEPGGLDAPAPSLHGVPVLIGSLHSQVGVAAIVAKALRPDLRISYVMTDGAALPLALSDLVHALRSGNLLDGTITAGHAFGGEIESVSIPSALHLAVERQRADIVICAMGPGVVGTSSVLGTTALETAGITTAVVQLGGQPVLIARASSGDARSRHRGISHHTITSLGLTPFALDVAVPIGSGLGEMLPSPHRSVEVEVPSVEALLLAAGIEVTTMGRGPDADPLFFQVVGAAAVRAVQLTAASGTVEPA